MSVFHVIGPGCAWGGLEGVSVVSEPCISVEKSGNDVNILNSLWYSSGNYRLAVFHIKSSQYAGKALEKFWKVYNMQGRIWKSFGRCILVWSGLKRMLYFSILFGLFQETLD